MVVLGGDGRGGERYWKEIRTSLSNVQIIYTIYNYVLRTYTCAYCVCVRTFVHVYTTHLHARACSARCSTHLPTELEVDHDNGHFRAGDDEDHKHKKEEAKQVVELILPDGLGEGEEGVGG